MPHVDRHTTHYHESCGCAEARIAEMGLKLQNALLAFGGAHRLNEEKDARIAELEAALGPFAALADRKQDDLDDDHLLYATWWDNVNRRQITMGDVRRAAAALGEKAN